ncbi:Protein CBG12553 [Caenorhabditis briggsae]|nr:Protein CBG12553 [Caenorhabditis briggsae]CAP31515.2 Protein CBG12553 [Caenorhabditis briggsae]
MPRHTHTVKRGENRAVAEEEITELELQMVTYEEKALENNEYTGFKFPQILHFPVPNKVVEMEAIDENPFSSKKSAFFMKRRIGRPEPEDEEEERQDESSDDSESGTEEEKRDQQDWHFWECFYFAFRQLLFSRTWILLLQFAAANYFGDRLRTDGFNLADRIIEPGKSVLGDLVVRRALLGLRRWDAQQFLFVADNHYIFEHSLAFFPGYPEVINIFRIGIHEYMKGSLGWSFPPWVITGILSVAVNLFFFHAAGLALFMAVTMMTRNVKQALLAVSIFAYNPASIFFTSAYSESVGVVYFKPLTILFQLFFALTITGFNFMLYAVRATSYSQRVIGTLSGTVIFGLSAVVRSNGLLNVIFVVWYWAAILLWEPEKPVPDCHLMIESLAGSKNDRYRREGQARLRAFERKRKQTRKVFRWTDPRFSRCSLVFITLVFIVIVSIASFGPYVFMSNSAAEEFCEATPRQKELVATVKKQIRMSPKIITIADAWEKAAWCRKPKLFGIVRQYYGEIQAKYWNVGLFGYWRIKKIPCFLMMLPAAILTVLAIISAWVHVFETKRWNNIWVLLIRSDHLLHLAPQAIIMLCTAVFVINAEVFTRLIFSSSPLLYIFIAQYIDKLTQGNTMGNRLWHYTSSPGILPFFVFRRVWEEGWKGKALYIYILGYFIFGTMAHAAWLPFT